MNRRELLKWIPPVVIAVTLPAHAQTSPIAEQQDIDATPFDDGVPPVDSVCDEGKTLICHHPHININRENIDLCVADEAVGKHVILHHDTIGPCDE